MKTCRVNCLPEPAGAAFPRCHTPTRPAIDGPVATLTQTVPGHRDRMQGTLARSCARCLIECVPRRGPPPALPARDACGTDMRPFLPRSLEKGRAPCQCDPRPGVVKKLPPSTSELLASSLHSVRKDVRRSLKRDVKSRRSPGQCAQATSRACRFDCVRAG